MEILGPIFIVLVAILVILSVILGLLVVRTRRNQVRGANHENRTTGTNTTQLDRIERNIREGTGLAIIAIGVAAIVAAGTVDVPVGWKVFLFAVGVAGIFYSIRGYWRR